MDIGAVPMTCPVQFLELYIPKWDFLEHALSLKTLDVSVRLALRRNRGEYLDVKVGDTSKPKCRN